MSKTFSDIVTRFADKHKKLFKHNSGATAIEYGLVAALVAVVILFALSTIGNNLNSTFTNVSDNLSSSGDGGDGGGGDGGGGDGGGGDGGGGDGGG